MSFTHKTHVGDHFTIRYFWGNNYVYNTISKNMLNFFFLSTYVMFLWLFCRKAS